MTEFGKEYRYGQWAGNPKGYAYKEGRCAEEVWSAGRFSLPHQCERKNGHGKEGMYCKQHALRHQSDGETK